MKGVPYVITHDGRTIRYPDPLVKVNDSIMVDIATGKIKDFIKFDSGKIIVVFFKLSMYDILACLIFQTVLGAISVAYGS